MGLEHFTDESIRDPRIAKMVEKVKITSQEFPNETPLATTVKLKLKDGRELSAHVNVPKGNEIHNPLTKEEKREKFLSNVSFSKKVSMENGEKALSMLERLEEVDDIKEVVKLLVA
jgi:2-methylcitrate dehydratase PrpD